MILRYATNLKLAKDLYAASKRKLTGNPYTKQLFTQDFKLSERAMKLAGVIEFIASGLFATSVLHKNISRLGSLVTFSVLSVAVYKRLEAGHGKVGAQHALDLLGLAHLVLSIHFLKIIKSTWDNEYHMNVPFLLVVFI